MRAPSGRWRAWGPGLLAHAAPCLLLLWFLLVGAYCWFGNGNFVSRDQWRFLPMVDHYLSGNMDWHELWESHTAHVKPGYKLLFLWNARWLGLDTRLEVMAGIVLLGVSVWLLLKAMDCGRGRGEPMPAFALFTAGVVLMSFNQWASYVYGLLALGGFGGLLLQSLLFLGFSRLLNGSLDLREGLLLVLVLLLGVFGFFGARGPAVLGACLTAVLAAWAVAPEARARLRRWALPFLVLGAATLAAYAGLLNIHSGERIDLRQDLAAVLSDPVGAFAYVSGILAQSMINLREAGGYAPSGVTTMLLCAFGYLLLGGCLWRYFRAQHWRSSWVPLMLIAYSALFALEVLLGRFGSDNGRLHGTAVPRYVFDAHLWLVGCVWILGLEWVAARSPDARRAAGRLLPAAALGLLLALEALNLWFVASSWQAHQRSTERMVAQLHAVVAGKSTVEQLPRWECPGKAICVQGIVILKKYHLNVARRDSRPRPPVRPRATRKAMQ
jgi:hypothetical protein